MKKLLLVLSLAALGWAQPPSTNARRLAGKLPCSATVTTNCVPVVTTLGAYVPAIAGTGDMQAASYVTSGADSPTSPCATAGVFYANTTASPAQLFWCPSAGGNWIGPLGWLAGTSGQIPFRNGTGNYTAEAGLAWNTTNKALGISGYVTVGPKTIGAGASQLPAAAPGNSGYITTVSDAASASDCTVGSGSSVAWCRSSGSAWVPLSTAGDNLGSAAASDVVALFSGSGTYLKTDGTQGTPAGDNLGTAASSDIVALFASGSCVGYLKNDGTCDTPGGVGTVTDVGDCSGPDCFSGTGAGTTLTFRNATSGTVALSTVAGALGTVALQLPAADGTIARTADIPAVGTEAGTVAAGNDSRFNDIGWTLMGHAIANDSHSEKYTLFWNSSLSQWGALAGIVFSSGGGAPGGNCTAGQQTYLDTTAHSFYDCTDTNTWTERAGGHTQGTDAGTTGTTFQIDSDNTGPKLKNNAGVLENRNAADNAFAGFRALWVEAGDGSAAGQSCVKEIGDPATADSFCWVAQDTFPASVSVVVPALAPTGTTNRQVMAVNTTNAIWDSYLSRVLDEGVLMPPRANIDFVGDGVTTTVGDAGTLTVTIPGGGHTQNTDTGTTSTCYQLDTDAGTAGPKLCADTGGLTIKDKDDNSLANLDTSGNWSTGLAGTTPWNHTGYTDDAAPSAPGTANQFTQFFDRTTGLPSWILNGGTQKYVALGDTNGAATLAPTEAYDATNWDADTAPPQKDAVRDKIETLAPKADPVFTSSLQLPNGASPTVDAAGETAVDTTTDQLQFYGAAKRALSSIIPVSFVIPAPVVGDDYPLMKAPYGMTILSIHGVLKGTTNVVGQLQECDTAGDNCADLDSDITFNGGDDADDGSLTDSAIAKDNWIAWKTTSVSDTPTSLTITVTYRVVPD